MSEISPPIPVSPEVVAQCREAELAACRAHHPRWEFSTEGGTWHARRREDGHPISAPGSGALRGAIRKFERGAGQ